MKRTIVMILSLVILASAAAAVELELGVTYGGRSVMDNDIEDVYGSGTVYFPYLALNMWKGLTLGFGFEGGYDRSGTIGIFNESTTLEVTGYEFFVSYQLKLKKFVPYVKLGYGSYSYEQTIDSPVMEGFEDKKSTLTVGAGFKFYLFKGFFAGGEIRYVPLKVKPFDAEVDLGGLRYAVAAGYTLRF